MEGCCRFFHRNDIYSRHIGGQENTRIPYKFECGGRYDQPKRDRFFADLPEFSWTFRSNLSNQTRLGGLFGPTSPIKLVWIGRRDHSERACIYTVFGPKSRRLPHPSREATRALLKFGDDDFAVEAQPKCPKGTRTASFSLPCAARSHHDKQAFTLD